MNPEKTLEEENIPFASGDLQAKEVDVFDYSKKDNKTINYLIARDVLGLEVVYYAETRFNKHPERDPMWGKKGEDGEWEVVGRHDNGFSGFAPTRNNQDLEFVQDLVRKDKDVFVERIPNTKKYEVVIGNIKREVTGSRDLGRQVCIAILMDHDMSQEKTS